MAAVTAETVIVELQAKVAQHDAAINASSRRFDEAMAGMGNSAKRTELQTTTSFRAITAGLGALTGALTTAEVLRYADAWTKAKNSLAVAGVTGSQQVAVLDQLFQSAQRNAAPLEALTTLYGRAAAVQKELGASQGDLIRFSDGVATALRVAGTDAGQASGALLQLGQALGSARVQAEEFNSINEGARPILQAVAAGLDAAGGSVAKLKNLVNEGQVSNRQFFEAFLKGLPTIQAHAANASLTISQAYTKIQNALTRYIGQTDEGLGASQRLAQGLAALADNFSKVADIVLKVAAIVAAAFIGRAIGGMVAALATGVQSLVAFTVALRAAGAAAALGGLATAAGPVGLLIGTVVVGALALFSTTSANATAGANLYADALRKVEAAAAPAGAAVRSLSADMVESQRLAITNGIAAGTAEIEKLKVEYSALFERVTQGWETAFISNTAIDQFKRLTAEFVSGRKSAADVREEMARLGNEDASIRALATQFVALLGRIQGSRDAVANLSAELRALGNIQVSVPTLGAPTGTAGANMGFGDPVANRQFTGEFERRNRLTAEQLKLEDKIAELRRDPRAFGLTEARLRETAQGIIAADTRRGAEGGGGGSTAPVKRTAASRFDQDIQQIRDRTAALVLEEQIIGQSYQTQEQRRMALQLEQDALRDLREEARRKGQTDLDSIRLTPEQVARINEVSTAYAAQADQLRRVQESQDRAKQSASEFYDAFKSNMIGAITGAKSLSEALSAVLKKLADLLLNSAFDALFKTGSGNIFSSLFGAGGGGGFLSSLFGGASGGIDKGAFKAMGGNVSAGQSYIVGEKRPEVFVPDRPGRIVPSLPQYASMVSRGGSQDASMVFAPVIDARGADVAAVARLESTVARMQQEFSARVVSTVRRGNEGRFFK